ncbi:hypothetical protein [Pseudomonas sp. NPDC089396]|uniref:hypothetical protein n=1 Tax=Pseudomonas sp. NPDC089396 TaxID=3364461 RepID=UPI00383437D6
MPNYSWLLHCSRETAKPDPAGEVDYAVNWVMPRSDDGTALIDDSFWVTTGNLFFPWRLEVDHWWVVTGTLPGTLGSFTPLLHQTVHDPVRNGLQAQIKQRTKDQPLSRSTQDLDAGAGITLVDAIAPLSHLPAKLSSDVLGTTVIVSTPAPLNEIQGLVPEFNAVIGGERIRFTPDSIDLASHSPQVEYHYALSFAQAQVPETRTLPTFTFSVVSNTPTCCATTPAIGLGQEVPGGALARINDVAPVLSPVSVLGTMLDELLKACEALDVAGEPSWKSRLSTLTLEACLVRLLGSGEQRMRPAPGSVHLTHWARELGFTQDNFLLFLDRPATLTLRLFIEEVSKLVARQATERLPSTLADLCQTLSPLLSTVGDQMVNHVQQPLSQPGTHATVAAFKDCLTNAQSAPRLYAAWLAACVVNYHTAHPPVEEFDALYLAILPNLHPGDVSQMMNLHVLQVCIEHLHVNPTLAASIETWTPPPGVQLSPLSHFYAQAFFAVLLDSQPENVPPLLQSVLDTYLGKLQPPRLGMLAEDGDLSIQFALAASQMDEAKTNKDLRGYAIAVGAGYQDDHNVFHLKDELGSAWITNVACRVRDGAALWKPFETQGALQEFHETVGATRENGRQTASFNYSGLPLCARLLDKVVDSPPLENDVQANLALEFYWPEGQANTPGSPFYLPKLAYGVTYCTVASALSNAGRILVEALSADTKCRELLPAKEALADANATLSIVRYLSRVPPGVPHVAIDKRDVGAQCDRYGNESRAMAYQVQQQITDLPRIALIRPNTKEWRGGLSQLRLNLNGPDATPRVIERWLEADWAARTAGQNDYCDDLTLLEQPSKIKQLQHDLLTRKADATAEGTVRHPAVRAFGVELLFHDDSSNIRQPQRLLIEPKLDVSSGYIAAVPLLVKYVDNPKKAGATVTANNELHISLAAGWFVRATFMSLIPDKFFSGPLARIETLDKRQDWIDPSGTFHYFNSSEHWFECLRTPDWTTATHVLKQISDSTRVGKNGNNVQAVLEHQGGIVSELLSGLYIERHEWHWTGYPLAFAHPTLADGRLEDWAGPFLGTESTRDSIVYRLEDELDATRGLRLAMKQPRILSSYRLPRDHGANYSACLMRPLWRFEEWLFVPKEQHLQVVGVGGLIPAWVDWADRSLRLSPPRVRRVHPLVRTYQVDDQQRWQTSTNAAVLELDDILYRTEAGVRLGGVGESIEVDLQGTRLSHVYEIGPNPLFHAGPRNTGNNTQSMSLPYPSAYSLGKGRAAQQDAKPDRALDWGITADAPFGLTYDLDRNAKVAQTAIMVRPHGTDVFQYWVMARVRLRRMLEPDPRWTEHAGIEKITLDQDNQVATLQRRPDGNDWVAQDFCLSVAAGSFNLALKVVADTATDPVTAPSAVFRPDDLAIACSEPRRLICSWHKGGWNNDSEQFWGLQVVVQAISPGPANQRWITRRTYSPYASAIRLSLNECKQDTPINLLLTSSTMPQVNASLSPVLLSDYSESHWLTFIATPYRNLSFAQENVWLEESRQRTLAMFRSSSKAKELKKESISRDLLINPVSAGDYNASLEERFEVESASFHLLLVFEAVHDVATPQAGEPLGRLKHVYKPTRPAITDATPSPQIVFTSFMTSNPGQINWQSSKHVGYLYRFHRATLSPAPSNWEAMLELMFPESQDDTPVEASIRWTPEFLGPMPILGIGQDWEKEQWAQRVSAFSGQKISLRLKSAASKPWVNLQIDPQLGWYVDGNLPPPKLFDNRNHGSCRVTHDGNIQVLELLAAGDCLVAQLLDWPGNANQAEARLFNSEGDAWQQTYIWKK